MKQRVALLCMVCALFCVVSGCGITTQGIISTMRSRAVTVYVGKTTEAEVVEQIGTPKFRTEGQLYGNPTTSLSYQAFDTLANVSLTVCEENGQCRTNIFGATSSASFNTMDFTFHRGGVLIRAFP